MPVCGFNKKMLEGLSAFTQGLIEHGIIYRGELNEETTEQGIRRELSDMARLLPELSRIQDAPKRLLTEAVVKYAMGFYMHTRMQGLENLEDSYQQTIAGIMKYFHAMDETYYEELEGQPDDMKQLTEFLDSFGMGGE